MKHPPEDILETHALDPDAPPGEIGTELASHLEHCPACREWVEYLRSFYGKFRRLPFSASPTLQGLLESLKPPATVFHLQPFQRWKQGDVRPVRRTTVLAASSDTLSVTRYHRLGVLSSEEEGVVLRLIYDAQENVVDVFLVSSEPRKRQHAIVSFPVLHLECVTDVEGRGRIPQGKEMREASWATQYAVVRLPMCEITLPASGQLHQTIGDPESHTVIASVEETEVSFRITTLARQARPITTALISDDRTPAVIVPLADGRGSAPRDPSPSRLVLRLYN